MATEKKTLRRRKKKGQKEEDNLTKDETEVAKYLRWNMPTKKSTMYGDEVQYFLGSKAVDFLLDSKWATGKAKSTVEFTDRESACIFLEKEDRQIYSGPAKKIPDQPPGGFSFVSFRSRMVFLGLISRVHRIKKEKKSKEKKDDRKKSKEKGKSAGDSEGKDSSKGQESPKPEKEKKGKGTSKEDSSVGKKKKKVKVTLEPHEDNIFLDDEEEV